MDPQAIKVTGIEAARQQLETAVKLYFDDGNIVAIHTLGAAAHEILERINRNRDGPPTGHEMLSNEDRKRFRIPQNFYKHAKSTDDEVEVFDYHTYLIVEEACMLYGTITGERVPLFRIYVTWAELTWARGREAIEADPKRDALLGMMKLGKQAFFDYCMAVVVPELESHFASRSGQTKVEQS